MEELANDKKTGARFTRDMHHNNVAVFFIVQNLFKQGSSMRDIALKSSSKRQRHTGTKDLEKAYHEAIKESYGYLVINLQAQKPEPSRLQSD